MLCTDDAEGRTDRDHIHFFQSTVEVYEIIATLAQDQGITGIAFSEETGSWYHGDTLQPMRSNTLLEMAMQNPQLQVSNITHLAIEWSFDQRDITMSAPSHLRTVFASMPQLQKLTVPLMRPRYSHTHDWGVVVDWRIPDTAWPALDFTFDVPLQALF